MIIVRDMPRNFSLGREVDHLTNYYEYEKQITVDQLL